MSTISTAKALLHRVKELDQTGISVAFSGGKDSLTVLDLAITVFGRANVYPVYLYFIRPTVGLEREMLEFAEKHFKVKVDFLPHPALQQLLARSQGRHVNRDTMGRAILCKKYSWNTVEAITRKRSGHQWMAYGIRMQDSLHRRGMLNKCQGFWHRNASGKFVGRVYPCFDWSHNDVAAFLKSRKLPIPVPKTAKIHKSSGTGPTNYKFMLELKKYYPEDFARLDARFPLWKESLWRDQVRAQHNILHNDGLETCESLDLVE